MNMICLFLPQIKMLGLLLLGSVLFFAFISAYLRIFFAGIFTKIYSIEYFSNLMFQAILIILATYLFSEFSLSKNVGEQLKNVNNDFLILTFGISMVCYMFRIFVKWLKDEDIRDLLRIILFPIVFLSIYAFQISFIPENFAKILADAFTGSFIPKDIGITISIFILLRAGKLTDKIIGNNNVQSKENVNISQEETLNENGHYINLNGRQIWIKNNKQRSGS